MHSAIKIRFFDMVLPSKSYIKKYFTVSQNYFSIKGYPVNAFSHASRSDTAAIFATFSCEAAVISSILLLTRLKTTEKRTKWRHEARAKCTKIETSKLYKSQC